MQHTTGTPLMWAFTGLLATAVPVQAHFLWLAQDPGATPQPARLFFGEHAGERDYHFPERLQGLAVIHRDADAVKTVAMDLREEDGFVGLISREPLPPRGVLEATATYGIYHGSLLHLISTDEVSRFDIATETWQPWPRMPVGRSSHDAVVLGSRLFVFGGWQLPGAADEGDWHARGLVIDLAAQQPEWREIAQPFQRRAIACATLNGQIVVIGGIDQEGTVSQQVDLYDPRAESWSQADPFPEREGMKGFGVSAWELDGCLYASGAEGVVYCLAAADGSWEVAGKLEQPRFFHRLLPGPGKTLLAVAGASRQGHLSGIEQLGPFAPPVRP